MKQTTITTENTVIAVDLHGVLFTFHTAKFLELMSGITITSLALYLYIHAQAALVFFIFTLTPAIAVLLASGYFMLKRGHRPIVEYDLLSSKKTPIPTIKRMWLWISNFYYPRTDFVEICWKLRQQGFSLILLSDIGPEAFSILEKRYKSTFIRKKQPLFSATFYPNSQDSNTIKLTPWQPKNARNFFKKFSQAFIRTHPQIKNIIFIDNSRKNIKRANQQSSQAFLAIRFTTTKTIKKTLSQLIPTF